MKKLKKLLSTVICAALLLTAIPLNSITASASDVSNFIYTVSNGYAVIKGYAGNEENVEIPSTLGGHTVTTIDALAFYNCATIKNIILPDTVTYIGDSAFFGCENLETVFFSDKVSDMGTFVFSGCCNLKEINVSENNFYFSSLDGVLFNDTQSMLYIYPAGKTELAYVIPNTVTAIAERAFFENSNLISVSLPASVISINTSVFNDCTNLTDINVNSENTRYSSIDGVLVDKYYNKIIAYPAGKTDVYYTIPDSVTGIGSYAFRNCKIVYLTIPNQVVSMDSDAFYRCTYLKSVSFGSGLSAIGSFAFYDCTALENVSIPENITVIESYAFNSCSSLNSITIPDSVTSIGKFAFHYTGYYNDRTNWEENVLYIDNHLITAKESLNGVYTVKTGTKTIAKMAFTRCYDLLSICFPKSIVNIGEEAFNDCISLDEVWYLGTEADKENIEIGFENSPLVMADWYFGSNAEVTNLKVTNISGGIRLTWDTLGNATRYLIYRKTLYSFGWSGYEFLSDSYSESYTDNDVESGVHVQYLVVAYVGRISKDGGTVVDTMYLLQPSATIKNVANGVNLSWTTVSGATQYRVYRSTYSGGKWSEYKLFAKPTTTYYTDKTAKSGVNYSYMIYACYGNYKSNGSFPVSITYLAKPSVKLTNAKTGVYLSWGKISGAKGYKVYRSTYSGGKWSEYKLFAKPTTTYYTDKTAKSGTKYRYVVSSAKGKVESYESSSVTSIYLSPRTPKVSKASTGIKVSWTKVTGAKGYTVYRRTYSGGKWSELKAMYKTTKLTVTDKTAKKGVKYQYVVRAYNGDYKSAVKYSSTIKR